MEIRSRPSKYIKELLLWLKKWKKLIAAFAAILLFCMTLIVIIVETCHEDIASSVEPKITPMIEYEYKTTNPDIENFNGNSPNGCYLENENGGKCTVACNQNFDVDAINALDLSTCTVHEIILQMKEISFPDNTISKTWLSGLSRDVEELTISSDQLSEIEEAAFSGSPFDTLISLTIEKSKIKYLRKDTFKDLRLETFQFRSSERDLHVELNVLEYILDYLVILQFSQCIDDSEAIKNMTGSGNSQFNKLQIFDLRSNTFKSILNKSFVDTPRIISIYMSDNNIGLIEVNAFFGIGSSLQLLDLKNNKLKTLPEGVFKDFRLNGYPNGTIDIEGNPWRCDCDLVWLKNFYIENIDQYFHYGEIPFICTDGNYSEVEFCPSSVTSEKTTPVTSITEPVPPFQPTTEKPVNFVYLNCTNLTNYRDELSGLNRIYSHTVQVRNATITYNFYQIQNTPNYEIKVLNSVGTDYLIWINSKNSSDYGCVTNIQETVVLNNLNYGMSYTICLLKEDADMVTPFDCTSLTVPLEWANSAWIINKHMPVVIGGVLAVTLALIVVTSIIMFYTIRQNPKLIKGNKRVVIVRNKSADALVMPNYEKQRYVPPSIYTNSEGYLTPRHKMYEKINERRFRPLNTITEKFYQDFHGTTSRHRGFDSRDSRDSRSSYTGFVPRRSVASEVYEPPPLPPNHPSERPCSSRQSTIYKN